MKDEQLLAILRLQATKNIGDITAKKLISACGSPEQIFKESLSNLLKIQGISNYAVQHIFDRKTYKKAEEELLFLKRSNYNYHYFFNDDYPYNLKHCFDAPILIFTDGNISLNTKRIISIVGTRTITNYGRNFCNKIIKELTPYQPIIVSGFAYGVDICAHKAAIDNKLQNIAVLAHGLDKIYPKAHKRYVQEINSNGGFITDFWHEESPMRENFLKRNRIVAGISIATIVIESGKKGGALVTADIANSYNRDVFAVPGRTNDEYSKGCNNLIKNNGAHILTSAEDIVAMLNWDVYEKKVKQTSLFVNLNKQEQQIFDYLSKEGKKHFDVIARYCNIPVYKLSSTLLEMELNGVIKPLPGKYFEV